MKYFNKRFLLALYFFSIGLGSYASHIAGGDISYNYVGNNKYVVCLNLFIDCSSSSSLIPTTGNIKIDGSCGSASYSLPKQVGTGVEVSQLCASQIISSSCNGGTLPGMKRWTYCDTLQLDTTCDYTITWESCCRNGLIINLDAPDLAGFHLSATINHSVNGNEPNNSPAFQADPIPYVCLGTPVNYSYQVIEKDGDSLVFSMIDPQGTATSPAQFIAPFSVSDPFGGNTTSINPVTGVLSFTPISQGAFVVSVLVEEYRNGVLIGTTLRDIQYIVQVCTNTPPQANQGHITNVSGGAVATDSLTIELCEGKSFKFDAIFNDPDATDTVNVTSNLTSVLPGASIVVTGINPVKATVSWVAPVGSSGLNNDFTITISDHTCPVPGKQYTTYHVHVLPATTIKPHSPIICGDQSVVLNAKAGTVFNWKFLNGSSVPVNASFSCNPCASAIAKPTVTTTYIVESNLSSSCKNIDTVTVTVVPIFNYTISQSSLTSCLNDTILLNITTNPSSSGFIYKWSPTAHLNNNNNDTNSVILTAPGNYQYYVSMLSPSGCLRKDTVVIKANSAPDVTARGLGPICYGESIELATRIESPSVCGLYLGTCNGGISNVSIGNNSTTNSTTSYPSPFGNYYRNAKHQFLYTANELNAAGLHKGLINGISFKIKTVAATTVSNNFTIKMGCTLLNEFSATTLEFDNTAYSQVFNPKPLNAVVGVNSIDFDSPYSWDGVSNLVIEMCMGANPTTSIPNHLFFYTPTSFNSCIYSRNDDASNTVCAQLVAPAFAGGVSKNRPNIVFSTCKVNVDTANYVYKWTPSAGLSNDTLKNPIAKPDQTTTYFLSITDKVFGCVDTAQVTLTVVPKEVSFTQDTTTGAIPLIINFTNTSSPSLISYHWDFGDGKTFDAVTNSSTTHTYEIPGTYQVFLAGTNALGCTDTARIEIKALLADLIIPNVFTPNNDSQNDVFKIATPGIVTFKAVIFNRWGKKEFEWTDPNNGWDGKGAPEGVYYYVINAEGVDGQKFAKNGNITLAR